MATYTFILNGNRCGTYPRIREAVVEAAADM
jgi:aerobic-type carbon monoxide dehydrogenase small subunit (CoxS/CutS family)